MVIGELDNSNNLVKEYVRGLSLGGGIGGILYCKESGSLYYDGARDMTSEEGRMKKIVVIVACVAIIVGVVAFLIEKRTRKGPGPPREIIPGIRVELAEGRDAGEFYARMIRSYLARGFPVSLTDDEWKWFMEATECRECNLYPQQFPHIMPNESVWEPRAMQNIATIVGREAEQRWRNHRDGEAQDLLRRVAVMGWHMEQENECLVLNLAGVKIQYGAYGGLSRFHRARGRAEKAREYEQHIETKKESLSGLGVFYTIASWEHFERVKAIALTDKDSLWRKEACMSVTCPFVVQNPRAQAEALQVLRTVAQKDPSAEVRQFAAACIPYADGTKKAP